MKQLFGTHRYEVYHVSGMVGNISMNVLVILFLQSKQVSPLESIIHNYMYLSCMYKQTTNFCGYPEFKIVFQKIDSGWSVANLVLTPK